MNILETIVNQKLKDLKIKGPALGEKVPKRRKNPLISFKTKPNIICEIKRSSPSKGIIDINIDPLKQVERYISSGVNKISVLTEKNFFSGSLNDLISIKDKFPRISVLRKDFIISEDEIETSYRAGADAILLIASILKKETFIKIYRKAKSLGLDVLVEVHSLEDINKIKDIKPDLVGINSRNLKTFNIDLFHPLKLSTSLDWDTVKIFESGIKNWQDALFVLSAGFDGMLVGEAVVKNYKLTKELVAIYNKKIPLFWYKLFKNKNKPIVKVCGITNTEDAYYVSNKGVNALGFVFAKSPRKAEVKVLEELKDLKTPKVAVVTPSSLNDKKIKLEIDYLIMNRLIDAIQFHGFPPLYSAGIDRAYPFFQAIRLKNEDDLKTIDKINSPRVLFDYYDSGKEGGTGKSITDKLIKKIKGNFPLWIAGGIGPDNVGKIVKKYDPELIDASSKLEAYPGKKDFKKIDRFFEEIENVSTLQ